MRPNPNPVPDPGILAESNKIPVKMTCTLTLPNGDQVTAMHESLWSSQDNPVHWSGTLGHLVDPPSFTDADLLRLYLEQQEDLTGGKLDIEYSGGTWPEKD